MTSQEDRPEPPTESRRVLITGANRGIGYELARGHLANGDIVWGSGRAGRTDDLMSLGPAGVIEMDLADESSIIGAIAELAQHLDGLDLLINCAGIDARAVGGSPANRGPFDLDAATFNAVINVNAAGPMAVTREALPMLRRGRDAMVMNISSQLGSMEVGAGRGGDTAYCVSKAALNMLSLKTAAELRSENIGVVMVHPGWVSTDMGGPSAQLTPQESAAAMMATFAGLTIADSGRFIRWDGQDHPW